MKDNFNLKKVLVENRLKAISKGDTEPGRNLGEELKESIEPNAELILKEIEKIEYWKGDAYQSGDDIELALEEIKRLIGYSN
mgnify:CR=1 FL=1|tara:strand:+ start:926 stop:1171 length:246 start_codon:yes stop_codon:yes gene_type:complete